MKDTSIQARMEQLSGMSLTSQLAMVDASYNGYAKIDKQHIQFVLDWLECTGVLLDPIYTSKLCRKVVEQIEAGHFAKGSCIVLIHSGGLQGWRGYQSRVERLLGPPAWQKIASFL